MFTLQNLTFPEQGISTELDIYFRLRDGAALSLGTRTIALSPGAYADFGTYFNMLSLGKWAEVGALDGLLFRLEGAGTVELRLSQALPGQSPQILYSEIVTFGEDASAPGEVTVDLSEQLISAEHGLVYAELRALEGGARITGGAFLTRKVPAVPPRLAVSITTFRREEAVRETVARLDAFLATSEFGTAIHVFVVDNGESAGIVSGPRVTALPNRNLGGAGGFARGLIEARDAGFTHCLFMDDDAAFHMENLHRTYAFLALSEHSDAAVAGAMISNACKWAMWENGAWFDGVCRPIGSGTDLRNPVQVFGLEHHTTGAAFRQTYPTLYGGWWFFAFPIAHVKHHPFPFFVRGDDSGFSLANKFRITLLNGVVSFQDDFFEKETPQVVYLDMRYHIIHHLIFPRLQRSAFATARVALRLILRSIVRFHYASAEAQLLAWRDVMEGPEFFAANADMAERRARIRALSDSEAWRPVSELDLRERHRLPNRSSWMQRVWSRLLNGHLVPFWGRIGNDVVVGIDLRAALFPIWGARRITYLNRGRDKGYTVRHSKRRFLELAREMTKTTWRFMRMHDALRARYRAAYPDMTAEPFWNGLLDREPPAPAPVHAAQPDAAEARLITGQ